MDSNLLNMYKNRQELSDKYLMGMGIEIGALHNPLKVKKDVIVKYVDRFDVPTLREHYPELAKLNLVNIDIIDDGEILAEVRANSQDFVILDLLHNQTNKKSMG